MTREPIYAALFEKLRVISSLVTASRKLKHWADVPDIQQPALFQAQKSENVTGMPKFPRVWELAVDVYLYVKTAKDPQAAPSTILNPLMDAVQNALAPDDPKLERCTLGGLVEHCWIEGRVETDEGALGDQAVAIVPILIKLTAY
jgi:hypothetical protein